MIDWNTIRQNPQFKKLSYTSQQKVVSELLKKELETNEQFQSLAPEAQARVAQTAWQAGVANWKPAFNTYSGGLTDQDRLALKNGWTADVPGTQDAYKRGLWLGERMDSGDANAANEARGWIVRNRIGTESLLVKIATGAKDVIDAVFTGDPLGNELTWNTQDYAKMSDYLLRKMPAATAQSTQTLAAVAGGTTALVENIGLNFLFAGTMANPGLFTKGLWAKTAAKIEAAKLAGTVNLGTSLAPMITTGVTGGITDIVRTFPKLVETGMIQGPKKAFGDMALTFGTGFAYDFAFRAAQDMYRFLAYPMAKVLKGIDADNPEFVKLVADASGSLDPHEVSGAMSKIFNGTVPQELLDQMPENIQASFKRRASIIGTLLSTPEFDINAPDGFRKFMYAAGGWDVGMDAKGAVKLFGDEGNLLHSWGSKAEAVNWALAQGWNDNTKITKLAELIVGGQPTARLKVFGTTSGSVADLSDRQVASMLGGAGYRGVVDPTTSVESLREVIKRSGYNMKLVPKIEVVDEATFRAAGDLKQDWLRSGQKVLVPSAMSDPTTKEMFTKYLTPILDAFGEKTGIRSLVNSPLSVDALNGAIGKLNGKVMDVGGGRYRIQWPGAQIEEASDLGDLNRRVWKYLLDEGAVSEDDYRVLLQRNTGYVLRREVDEAVGVPLYVVRARNGKIVQQGATLGDLSDQAVAFNLRLPEDLMPELTLDPHGKLVVSQTVATGNAQSLLRYMSNFEDTSRKAINPLDEIKAGEKVRRTLPDGSTVELTWTGGKRIVFESPDVGVKQTFRSAKATKEFLTATQNSWDELVEVAANKGFRVTPLRSGQVALHTADGRTYVTASRKEAMDTLAQQASVPPEGAELVKLFSGDTDDVLVSKISEKLNTLADDEWAPRYKDMRDGRLSATRTMFAGWTRPAVDHVVEIGERYGVPKISELARGAESGRRALAGKLNLMRSYLENVFTDPATGKLITKSQRNILGLLAQYDESQWTEILAKVAPDFDFTPAMRGMINRNRQLYETLGAVAGIDINGWIKNYMPHFIERSTPEGLIEMLSKKTGKDAVQEAFGGDLESMPLMKLMMRNSRLDATLAAFHEHDIVRLAEMYTERVYRDYYLKGLSDEMRTLVGQLGKSGQLPDAALSTVKGMYGALVGGVDDELGKELASSSIEVTKLIAEGLQKVSHIVGGDTTKLGKALEELAAKSVTMDLVGDVSKNVSLATLGFRPFRVLSNTAQYMNSVAFYGKYAVDAVGEVDDRFIQGLFQRGILDDKIFSAAGDDTSNVVKNFGNVALRGQQNTEYLTRSWTAYAAGKNFDDFLPGLRAGNFDYERFTRLANIDWMEETDKASIFNLLRQGKDAAARDVAMYQAVRTTMFDYTKENYPKLFQGTLGRLFGKFGVYPVGQIEMYRKIVRNGVTPQAVERTLRLVACSTLIYNAFRAVGVDYSGFTLTDPFAFSGGPLWSSAIDLTQAAGNGPEASLARQNLMRSWMPFTYSASKGLQPNIPRLLVPGALQIAGTAKGVGTALSGDLYGGLLEGIGAPRIKKPMTGLASPF